MTFKGSAPIALDAMGGDNAPGAIVEGARRAILELGARITLVGNSSQIKEAADPSGIEIFEASETIAMDDDPGQAVRRKKDSSLVRAAELVRDGLASAMVSAGNTGATMAAALLRMGRVRGVARPAIATPIPAAGGGFTVMLDSGANAECKPEWLVQFAQMGSVFCQERFGVASPRVGLLSIGEEPTKGNVLVKETHELLARGVGVNFVGNVEGRDIMTGEVDVVVTDGFTGNVTLKAVEGAAKFLTGEILSAMTASDEAREAAKILLPALGELAERIDPETTGGAMLLGVDGVCIISHGSSSPKAVLNALRVAQHMVDANLIGRLAEVIALAP